MQESPLLVELPQVESKSGKLTFVENKDVQMKFTRAYWIYDLAADARRGDHAHKNADRLIVCLSGIAEVILENPKGEKYTFTLNKPTQALYLPRLHWIVITTSKDAIILSLASCSFEEDEVIDDYTAFRNNYHLN